MHSPACSALSNNVFYFWPKSLMSSASVYETTVRQVVNWHRGTISDYLRHGGDDAMSRVSVKIWGLNRNLKNRVEDGSPSFQAETAMLQLRSWWRNWVPTALQVQLEGCLHETAEVREALILSTCEGLTTCWETILHRPLICLYIFMLPACLSLCFFKNVCIVRNFGRQK
jgi:hypothetical protein